MTTAVSEPSTNTVSITELHKDIGMIREAAQSGREIPLSYHHRLISHVVPDDVRAQERAEIERLRREVADLRNKLRRVPVV